MRRISLALLAVTSVTLAGTTVARAQSPSLVRPADFEVPASASFSVNADWSSMLGDIIDGQVVNCKDGNKTYEKTTDISNANTGIAKPNFLRLAGTVTMQCSPELAIANTSRTLSGTITSEALGLADGVFSLTCQFNANLAVDATVSVGLAVAGLVKIHVTEASPLPIACAFSGSGTAQEVATTVKGTIEGFAKIGDAASLDCASGVTGCIPFSVDNARVTITEATGLLDGYVGTGTYSYGDTFVLDEVVTAVDTVKRRVLGSSVRSSAAASPATMNVSLRAGSGSAVILRPAPAKPGWRGVVTPLSPIVVAAPVGASCSVKLKNGVKSWQSTSAVVAATGRVAFALNSTTMSAAATKLNIKLKNKPVVDATVSCRIGLEALPVVTEKLKLSL